MNKSMKLNALIYFEILFNSTDLLEKTIFKNKTVEVNTVKNEGRIYKKFKRTKTTPVIFGPECYLHGKTNCSANKRKITGGAQRQKNLCQKMPLDLLNKYSLHQKTIFWRNTILMQNVFR